MREVKSYYRGMKSRRLTENENVKEKENKKKNEELPKTRQKTTNSNDGIFHL